MRISSVPRRAGQIDPRDADIFRANATKQAMTQLAAAAVHRDPLSLREGGCERGYRIEGAVTIGAVLAGNVEAIGMASPDGAEAREPFFCGYLAWAARRRSSSSISRVTRSWMRRACEPRQARLKAL